MSWSVTIIKHAHGIVFRSVQIIVLHRVCTGSMVLQMVADSIDLSGGYNVQLFNHLFWYCDKIILKVKYFVQFDITLWCLGYMFCRDLIQTRYDDVCFAICKCLPSPQHNCNVHTESIKFLIKWRTRMMETATNWLTK
jgi:hypothetical protein